jgi:hypothetical protein
MTDANDFQIENGVLVNYWGSADDVVIPEGVTSIGEHAFSGHRFLTSVVIPDSVTSIGKYAFRGCWSLTSVVISDSVTSIDKQAFYGCMCLTSVVIPEGVISIGFGVFADCRSLTSVVIPDSVTSIGEHAFAYCRSLTSVVVPDGVTSIGEHAFGDCKSLTSVVIPESVTSIGECTFFGCESLSSVVIPKGVTIIEDSSFFCCKNLSSVVIPKGVTIIEDSAFQGCSSLTSVVIPESVTSIGERAFFGCESLYSVVIPDSVTSIGEDAFAGCASLTSVVIPKGVAIIGKSAFAECAKLNSISIPKSVTSIERDAFGRCENLTSLMISDGVTSIEDRAFFCCKSLSSVVIPDSITSIGEDAFAGCASLTSVVIPEGVTSIGESAFAACTKLNSISIPKSVTSIGRNAFGGCEDLIIIGARESYTEKYAEKNNISFIEKTPNAQDSSRESGFEEIGQMIRGVNDKLDKVQKNSEVIIGNTEDIKAIGEDTNRKVTSLVHFIESDLQDWLKEEKKRFSASSPSSDDEVCIAASIARSNFYINQQLRERDKDEQIKSKERELRELFEVDGISIWDRLLPSTRTSLISAGVLWESCKGITNPDFDYSGICISSTSALECELRRWFYIGYQRYLMENAGDPSKMNPSEVWSKWPEELLNIDRYKYEKAVYKGEEIPTIGLGDEKTFTMGMLQYLFYKKKSANQALIKPYLQSIVKKDYYSNPGKAMNDFNNPNSFVKQIETVRVSYRNPAAHSEIILKDIAEECYQQIIGKAEAYRHETKVLGLIMLLYEFLE